MKTIVSNMNNKTNGSGSDKRTSFTPPTTGCGKQLRLISWPCAQGDEHHQKDTDKAMVGCDFVPPLSVEDEAFLSNLIPSPPFDELDDMVYDMGAEHFMHEEVFETTMTSKKDYTTAPTDGTFVRHATDKDIISVRGFGKSRPGSLKFR